MINSLFRSLIKNLGFNCFIFSFPEFQALSIYFIAKIHLIMARIHLVFSTSLSSRYPFVTGVLHEGSTWWFIKDSISFSKCSSTFFSKELKYSSSCNPECNSFYHIIGGGIMSFLIIEFMFSWFTCGQEWDILNPSISSLELPWVIIHLKPCVRTVAIYGAYKWPKFFIHLFQCDILSRQFVHINSILLPVSG